MYYIVILYVCMYVCVCVCVFLGVDRRGADHLVAIFTGRTLHLVTYSISSALHEEQRVVVSEVRVGALLGTRARVLPRTVKCRSTWIYLRR